MVSTRMSNNMISYNYLTGLNKANYKQVKAMEQMYSEKGRLTRPSDDPVDTVLDMRYKINLTLNEQYNANNGSAMSWMDLTHDSMDGVTNILHRVRELVIEAAKPSPQLSHDAIAEEISALVTQIMEVGNTTLGDRHIFAGQADRAQAPYYMVLAGGTLPDDYTLPGEVTFPAGYTIPAGATIPAGITLSDGVTPVAAGDTLTEDVVIPAGAVLPAGSAAPADTVVYTGDNHRISMVLDSGAVNPAYDAVNLTGNEVFNNGRLFSDLIDLRDRLRRGENAAGDLANYLSGDALGNLDVNTDALLASQSFLSAKMSMHRLNEELMAKSNVQINESISKMEDVNIADASIAFTIAQTAYNAALAMGAQILPMSLVDFLR